jgi:lysophospholipase L1-like esterase
VKVLGCKIVLALAVLAVEDVSFGRSGNAEAALAPVKIMPLGDSLTDGHTVPGSYRIDLEDDLLAGGVTPDFVGSLTNGPTSLADKHHEGHPGWRIDQIDASIGGWLTTYQPDVVLLMIGTNDIVQDYQLATAPTRLGGLLDRIHQLRPAIRLIVSSVPPLANATDDAQAASYNADVRSLVQARAGAGRPISFVDVSAALTKSDLTGDGIHLTAAAYSKVADAWYPAIQAALGSPSVTLTAPTSGTAYPSGTPVRLEATASDADGIARVEFFAGAAKLGDDTAAPYEWVWTTAVAGSHSLTARAVDTTGATGVSLAVSIVVDPPAGEAAFYRAVNIFGPALTIDGRTWEPTTTSNFQAGPGFYENQSVPLVPATDPARASMIRSSAWGQAATQASLLAVPAGTYDVYLYVWEDNYSATFDVRLEGQVVLSGFRSGGAGSWSRLGPWRTSVSDASLDVSAGPDANVSGIEVWRVAASPASSAPHAAGQAVTTTAGAPLEITLAGDDADTCELTFSIGAAPAHGTLGTLGAVPCAPGSPNTDAARVTYTPAAGYSGSDVFSYRVSDGSSTSPAATVSITVTASPTGDPAAVHVADLDGGATNNGKTWSASATTSVLDGAGRAVSGLTVTGRWSSGATASCVTATDGRCTTTLGGIQKKTTSATFTVTQLAKAGYRYDPAANGDPDGDSTGTVLTVAKS